MSRIDGWGILFLVTVFLVSGVQATISDIPLGGTVFIGEEGLDLTAAGINSNSELGYWAPGNSLTNPPDYVLPVGNAQSFYVNPQIFVERTGPWYRLSDKTPVLYAQDPNLRVRLYDVQTGRDATGLKVVAGEEMQFRIDTNLYTMAERNGVAGAPVTIHVRDPNGVEYSSLLNKSGQPTSLIDIPVNSGSYFTVPLWYINAPYISGIYDIWAVCNANHMNDNYPEVGKTITAVLEQPIGEGTVTITVSTTTPAPTTPAPTTPAPTTPVPTTTTPAPTITTPSPTTTVPTTTPPITTTVPPVTTTPGFGALAALGAGICALAALRKYR